MRNALATAGVVASGMLNVYLLYSGSWSGSLRAPSGALQKPLGNESSTSRAEETNSSSYRPPRLAIFVHSGAALERQRDRQRVACFPHYEKHGIEHHFVVGMPSFDERTPERKAQGELATGREIDVSMTLLREQKLHGDILVTPHRDYYRDLPEKLMGVLKFGVETGADYVVKADDDFCANVTAFLQIAADHEREHPGAELYAGVNYWSRGDEYDIMKGPHGETAPFMGGAIIALSRRLARTVAGPDWMPNVLRAAYGTSSDDANLGKMIQRAEKLHNLTVISLQRPTMILCQEFETRTMNLTELRRSCGTV